METLSKQETAQYIYDYICTYSEMMRDLTTPVQQAFINHMRNEGREKDITPEYFNTMMNVYIGHNALRFFSIVEDCLLNKNDFISNNDLNYILKNVEIISKPRNITNKQLIKIMRNCYNHNSSVNEPFKMSRDGLDIQFECYKDNLRGELFNPPIILKISAIDMYNIATSLYTRNKQTIFSLPIDIPLGFPYSNENIYNDLDKIVITRPHISKKLDQDTVLKLGNPFSFFNLNMDPTNEQKEILETISKEQTRITLDNKQKATIASRYAFVNLAIIKDKHLSHCKNELKFIISSVIPIPSLRFEVYSNQIIQSLLLSVPSNLSFSQIGVYIDWYNKGTLTSLKGEMDEDVLYYLSCLNLEQMLNFTRNIFYNYTNSLPTIIFIDYVISHLCEEDKICINGKKYSKEKLRNCFTHGRWYLNETLEIEMFDGTTTNTYDCNYTPIGELRIQDLYQWAYNYAVQHGMGKRNVKK